MTYVTPIYGGSAEQIDYRLGLVQHGCGAAEKQFAYRTDVRERPLVWIGAGLAEFGIEPGSELTAEQHDLARRLMAGAHPYTGEQLVAPKVAVPEDAKLPLSALVSAVERAAAERGLPEAAAVFANDSTARKDYASAVRAVHKKGEAAYRRADHAVELARAAGLDPDAVWGAREVRTATRNLTHDDGTPRRVSVGIVGYDLNITVPKSYSLLLAFAPPDVADRVEEMYAAAVERTFRWVEERAGYVKRGHHGDGQTARHEASTGLSGWVMTHRTARPVGGRVVGDPHWHVHITISSMARSAVDGEWLTVASGGRDLMRHTAAIDRVTQAQIRQTLYREYGITYRRSEAGWWELAHVPDAAIRQFSKRNAEVTEALAELGYTSRDVSARNARVLARPSPKKHTTAAADTTLRELWRTEAAAAGLDPDQMMGEVFAAYRAGHTTAGPDVNAVMEARFGIGLDDLVAHLVDEKTGLTAHARRFSKLDVVAAVADGLPLGASVEEVGELVDTVLQHPHFLALPGGAETELVGGHGRHVVLAGAHQMVDGQLYTTADVPKLEQHILTAVERSRPEQQRAVVSEEKLGLAVAVAEAELGFPLSVEQRTALRALVTGGRAIEALEGQPGTGKTTLMAVARVAWEAEGHTVLGAATAAVASQNLEAESGIGSRTVAQILTRIDTGQGLSGVDVVVLDEANLTNDRDRARLYAEAMRTGTKIVEVGDAQQLRGVGVGSMFGYLHTALDGPRLTENRRQRAEHERAALADFRAGNYHQALRGWAAAGGLVATETTDQGLARLVDTWLQARQGVPDPHTQIKGLLAVAGTNEQVRRINEAIQTVRAHRGELGPSRTLTLPHGQLTVHVGDQVLIRRNDRHEAETTGDAVLNGYRGVVTALEPDGVRVVWHQPGQSGPDAERTAVLSHDYLAREGLSLGYCLTAHKAEGLTVGGTDGTWTRPDGHANHGTVLVWTPGLDMPALYVAASRDKGETLLFANREELETDREQLVHGDPRSEAELRDRCIDALASRAEATAETANDRPVSVDLGQAPAAEDLAAEREHQREETRQREQAAADEHHQQARQNRARLDPADLDATWARMRAWRREADEAQRAAAAQERAGTDERRQAAAAKQERERQREQVLADLKNRPGGLLSDAELTTKIEATHTAERRAATAHAQAAETLAEREPQVAAGAGPRVQALHQTMAELRGKAELQRQAEALEKEWQAVVTRASRAAGAAASERHRAETTPWYKPGQRRDHERAAQTLAEDSRWAQDQAQLIATRFGQYQQRLDGPERWRTHIPTAERAEHTRERDLDQAHRHDHAELDRLRREITHQAAAGEKARQDRATLTAEQTHRAGLEPDAARLERTVRNSYAIEQLRHRAEQLAHQRQQQQREHEHGLGHEYDYHHREHYRHGPDLGLGR
ncbi:hypothetical protein GCM10012275_63220 [Longimycelium tulufanense]|uniref:TrwC relaxase domain-containing protein n=1 Tax=Longimycelium tulufanense TaxID=907463 RepID=A0A8J3CKK1_9PSEU|nr:MobF family relaxase [Longimycelium tulufanense]GGM83969.1 hypothetical protein GCM10012275_63220 [Longimycelium tulufanense]